VVATVVTGAGIVVVGAGVGGAVGGAVAGTVVGVAVVGAAVVGAGRVCAVVVTVAVVGAGPTTGVVVAAGTTGGFVCTGAIVPGATVTGAPTEMVVAGLLPMGEVETTDETETPGGVVAGAAGLGFGTDFGTREPGDVLSVVAFVVAGAPGAEEESTRAVIFPGAPLVPGPVRVDGGVDALVVATGNGGVLIGFVAASTVEEGEPPTETTGPVTSACGSTTRSAVIGDSSNSTTATSANDTVDSGGGAVGLAVVGCTPTSVRASASGGGEGREPVCGGAALTLDG
jgi:hypothetical protein